MPNVVDREKEDKQEAVQAKKRQAESAIKVKTYFLTALTTGMALKEVEEMVALGFEPHQHEEMLRHRAVLAAKQKVEKAKRANPLASPSALKDKLEEAYLKAAASMSKKEVAAYKDCGIKITGSTLPMKARPVIDSATASKPGVLGNNPNVFKIMLAEDGVENQWFAKPFASTSNEQLSVGEENAGIKIASLSRASRSLATNAVANRLGWDVIVQTKMAVGMFDKKETPILLMKPAAGKKAEECDLATLNHPAVIRSVVMLQVIDIITGQTDRHRANYFIDMSGPEPKVTGIDNDQCMGDKITSAGGMASSPDDFSPNRAFNGATPPPVIDEEMKVAILSLKESSVGFLLGKNFTDSEVMAAKQRLKSLQDWVQSSDCLIISPAGWSNPDVQKKLTVDNNYTVRDRLMINDMPRYSARCVFKQQLLNVRNLQAGDTLNGFLAEFDKEVSLTAAEVVAKRVRTIYPIMTDIIGLKKCVAIDQLFVNLSLPETVRTEYLLSAPSGRVGLIKTKCREVLLALATRQRGKGNTITAADFDAVVDKALSAALMKGNSLDALSDSAWLMSNVMAPIRAFAPKRAAKTP